MPFLKVAVAGLVLVVLASACSTGPGAQAPSASTVATTNTVVSRTNTVPEALAVTNDASSARASVIEAPTLAPYGPGSGQFDISWLADQAALVVLESQRSNDLDLTGLPVLADRVAIGLAQLGLSFTRSDTADVAGHYGTIINVHDDTSASLARWPRLGSSSVDGATSVRQQTQKAIATQLDVQANPASVDLTNADRWVVAETADPSLLATELTASAGNVIAWSNREAQRYVTEAVTFGDRGIAISTTSRTSPASVEQLPYDSGMAIANTTLGWATISATVQLPEAAGLWPAIWLVDADACQAPGRCAGYESSAYHEIDLLEVRSQTPNEAHVSLHWWDERVRSSSEVAPIDSRLLTVELERKPGLLIWRIDGRVVSVVAGRVESLDRGPHRLAPMRLVVNTAVGGSFAGSQEIGRDGMWLGEALVPESYPSLLDATFEVRAIDVVNH